MNPLTSLEVKLCQSQAKIFETSVSKTNYSSLIFIRRFMYSSIAKSMDDGVYLFQADTINDGLNKLNEEFGESSYGKIKYSEDQMYWIGYIYRCISIKYKLSSKSVYKLFNADEIVKYYNICHTFDIVDAAERIMESINYNELSIEDRAYNTMKRLLYTDKLRDFIGKKINVIIDRPIGFNHNGIIYTQNYGYIKDLKALDDEYQDVYVIGIDKPLKSFMGKVIGIINRTNDIEDKLIICDEKANFSKDEIMKMVAFQEKFFSSKIILNN